MLSSVFVRVKVVRRAAEPRYHVFRLMDELKTNHNVR